MITDNLDAMTDAQLSEAVAVEIEGWKLAFRTHPVYGRFGYRIPEHDIGYEVPKFATSANAVLPIATKSFIAFHYYPDGEGGVFCGWQAHAVHCSHKGTGTFARAACIALLRSKRAQETKECKACEKRVD